MRAGRYTQLLIAFCLGTGLTMVGQSAASASAAAVCPTTPTPSDKDQSSYFYAFQGDTNIRTGPYWGCDIVNTAGRNNLVDYHCYTDGEDGTWTYLRTKNTVYGWVWDPYLSGDGSGVRC